MKGVGKDSLISRIYTGDCGKGKIGTAVSIPYQTNKGGVILDFVDEKADMEILIFEKAGEALLILCGNKIDLDRNRTMTRAIRQLLEEGKISCYYDISARSMYNIEKPITAIIRHFTGEEVVLLAR